MRDIGPKSQDRYQRFQPRPNASGQPGYVEPEPYTGVPREFSDSEFEDVIIDKPDHPQLFDRRYEFAAGDDTSARIAHAQQTFEIIRPSRHRANNRLECE